MEDVYLAASWPGKYPSSLKTASLDNAIPEL